MWVLIACGAGRAEVPAGGVRAAPERGAQSVAGSLLIRSAEQGGRPAAGLVAPVELAWVIHVGPLSGSEPYEDVRRARDELIRLARSVKARASVLVTGDVAEEALARGHGGEWRALVADGFEVGVRVPATLRQHERRWSPVDGISRFGERGFEPAAARRAWSEHRAWVDTLVGAENVRAVDAEPLLPSVEAPFARENHVTASFSRAGRWLSLTDESAVGPWRPASSDEPGREIEAGPRGETAGLVELDRSGQVGDPFDPTGDASVFMLREAFLRRLGERWSGPRAFGFLTRATPAARAFEHDVARLVRVLAAACDSAPAAPRRARWATASGLRTAFLAWEAAGPRSDEGRGAERTRSLEPLALRTRAMHLAAIGRVRAEHARWPTTPLTAEFRMWAATLWRAALASTHADRIDEVFPATERAALAQAFTRDPAGPALAKLDEALAKLEALARQRPATAKRRR